MTDNEEIRKISNFLDAQERMFKISKEKKPNFPLIEVNILYPNCFQ
jgi:hypothetical protein